MYDGPTLRGGAGHGSQRAARDTACTPRPPSRTRRHAAAFWPAPAAGLLAGLLAAGLLLAGCGAATTADGGSGGGSGEIKVFAAASLTDAFTQLGADFEAAHPGVKVVFNFAGAPDLVTQIKQGAPADVFASADTGNMDKVADLVSAPRVFAGNELAIAVVPGNPEKIASLSDLARDDLKVVLGAPELPAGKCARQVLSTAGVTVKPVSLEDNVKGVVTKVSLGEADAGIVWVTDVTAAHGKIGGVTIPSAQNTTSSYPIAVVDESERAADAQAFVDLVLSADGRRVLRGFGFLAPPQ